jgi:ADP-heptose:LPS heptosyltransferase
VAVKRVLVLRALGLGDLLTGVPALRALRRHFPEHHLQLAAPRVLEPLARLTGAVDEVVDTAPLAPVDPMVEGADWAVNLHGRGPESIRLLAATRPERLLTFRHPEAPASVGGPAWRDDEHEVIRWCRLVAHNGIPADPFDLLVAAPVGGAPPELAGATVIHPGAASASRRWPPDRWARVARTERLLGRRVLVTGSNGEVDLARAVADGAGLDPEDVLAGRTDLWTLAAVIATAARVVCGDTGVAHLATAFGTPSVVLFGPTAPGRWGPPTGPHRVLWRGREGDPHGDEVDPGLLGIEVGEVLAALADLPERESA